MDKNQERLAIVMMDAYDAIADVATSKMPAHRIFATHMTAFQTGMAFAIEHPDEAKALVDFIYDHQPKAVREAGVDLGQQLVDGPPDGMEMEDLSEFVQEQMNRFLSSTQDA